MKSTNLELLILVKLFDVVKNNSPAEVAPPIIKIKNYVLLQYTSRL